MGDLLKSLNIEPVVMLANGILFLVLVQVLDKVFWKPMQAQLNQRKQTIMDAYAKVDTTRGEMESLQSEYQTRMNRIEAEARAKIQDTVLEVQHQRDAMIAEARAEAASEISRGLAEIEREKAGVIGTMHAGLDSVASGALGSALGIAPNAAQQKLVKEFVSMGLTN
jgi:F-type H+-transporting ATPase subunit b